MIYNFKNFYFFLFIHTALIDLLSPSLHAFEVSPLVVKIKDVRRSFSKSIVVSNPSNEILAIETQIFRIIYSKSGKRTLKPIDDGKLIVYPIMKVIHPKSYQRFLIQWAGDPLRKSEAYILSFSQLPINAEDLHGNNKSSSNRIKILLTFNAVVHVSPEAGKAVLSSDSIGRFSSSGNQLFAHFTVTNLGNKYAFLSDYKISISHKGNSINFLPDELRTMGEDSFIPPEMESDIKIPLGDFSVDFKKPVKLKFLGQ